MMIVLQIIHLLVAVGLIAGILLQSGKAPGLSGAITGGAETLLGSKRGRKIDRFLSRATAFVAISFMVTSILLAIFLK